MRHSRGSSRAASSSAGEHARARKVIVTFAGGRAGVGICKALKDGPALPHIIAIDSEKYSLQRAVADERFLAPRGNDPLYIPFLKRIIERTGAEFLWPVHESEIKAVADHADELDVRTFLADAETIAAGQDKMESYRRFRNAGVLAPESVMLNDRGDLRAAFDSFGPDLWVRMTKGSGGKGALPVSDFDRAARWIDFHGGWGSFTAAPNISNGRWSSESIWRDGQLIAMQGRHNLLADFQSLTMSGITGFTQTKQWVSDPELDDTALRAIKALTPRPHGVFMVDFVSDEDRRLYVTEVNVSRFGSTGFSYYRTAEINPPYTVMQLAFGEEPAFEPPLMDPFPQDELMIQGYGHGAVFVKASMLEQQEAEYEWMLDEVVWESRRAAAGYAAAHAG